MKKRSEILLRENETIAAAVDRIAPDDLVIYFTGPFGRAPDSLKREAEALHSAGRCLLVQRRTRQGKNFEYIAVKTKPIPQKT